MSSDRFLSQNDVDSLFGDQIGEVETIEKPAAPEPTDGIRTYNLGSQERIIRGRMPTLEMIHERFSTRFRIGLANYLRKSIEVSFEEVKFVKYSEFLRNLAVPTSLNLVQIAPFNGAALVVIEPGLTFHCVDHLFGGNGRIQTRVEGREFTYTEQRINQRMLDVFFSDYQASWESVHPIKFELMRSEMNLKFANITSPNETVITSAFNIDLGSGSGKVYICIPYSMIEPVRDILAAAQHGEPPKVDQQWTNTLTRQIHTTEVDIRVTLGTSQLQLKELISMRKGDVIPLTIGPTVQAAADGVPVWDCSYGTTNGKYAIRIEDLLTPPDLSADSATPEPQH